MHRFVIVGGGIAGMVMATHLSRRLGRRAAGGVLLIDRNFAHVWKPMLHTFAAGTANPTTQTIPFASHATRTGFKYRPGTLEGLDRAKRTVEIGPVVLPDGQRGLKPMSVGFDTLVLAIGSHSNDFETPGVDEHCFFLDDVGQACRFEAELRSHILRAMDDGSDPGVVIVGGGATGVELAAELMRCIELLSRYDGTRKPPRLSISLVESGPRLLAGFPEQISSDAAAKLKELGIHVMTGTKVTGADATGVSLGGGRRIDAALRVWAAGVKAPPVAAKLDGLSTNKKGQIIIRPTLQSLEDDDIFVIGDCASLEADGKPLPSTAQVARQQALFLAKALKARLGGTAPLPEFHYSDKGSLVDLGEYAAYGSLGQHGFFRGAVIKGRLAQAGHDALYRMHQLDMNGVIRGGIAWMADDLLHAVRPKVDLR